MTHEKTTNGKQTNTTRILNTIRNTKTNNTKQNTQQNKHETQVQKQ